MSLVDQRSQYDKNYHSFLAGVDLCKRQSGTHSKCHALSFDLSLPCSSREPTCRTDQCIKIHPSLGHMAQSTVPTTLPCPQTQPVSPSTPSVPSSQPRPFDTPQTTSPGGKATLDATRTYGFDLNPHWQEDKDHYDNQKINGLTFPRSIRQSAFTQKLDIEGCDPLQLPVAALLYQQANNFWLRKLAHGCELYLLETSQQLFS